MIKQLRSRFFLALSALIVMLGFGSCKSSKTAESEVDNNLRKISQGDPSRILVLYGAPPSIDYKPNKNK